jgi:gliding motility-associated-like protein
VSPICQGDTLAASPILSLNGITGTWSPALNNQATTTYTFTPTSGQCASTATLSISVNPTIIPTFNAVSPICQGDVLAALPISSLNGITGTWSPALNNQATTTYTFTPTSGQCASTATLSISVNPTIIPTFNAVSPICQGDVIAALPISSLNGITGTWSPALNNQATTTYTFTPTSGQCATTATLSISVNPTIIPTFTAVSPICQGDVLAALPISSLNGITGTWSPALNNQATTTYTFTPTSGQCAFAATLSISVNPTIIPTFAAVNAICQGDVLAALPISSLNGITGTWSPALNNQASTTYTFTPTSGQCATSTTLSISVNPTIIPTFNAVSPICQGDVLAALPISSLNGITGTWSPALNNQATTTYTFTPTSGQCATSTTLSISVNPTIIPTFTAVSPICQGDVVASLPISSLNGIIGTWSPALNNQATTTYTFTPTSGQCATSTTLSISVNPTIIPTFTAVSPICQGDVLASLPISSLNGITGTWSPALNNQTTTTYTFTPTSGQCASTATLTITVNPIITPTFDPVNPICQGDVLAALPITSLNGITGTWSPALNNQATSTYTFTPSSGTCLSTANTIITIIEQPIAQFSVLPNDSILIGSTVYFQNNSLNATAYIWQVNNMEFSIDVNPSYLTNDEEYLVFTLVALNQVCTDTFEVQVPIIESSFVYAANCFTPDGDEFNPTWKPYISDNFDPSTYHLMIYNRWGEVIWECFDYDTAWDGTYGSDGQAVEDGVYTWGLRLKKKKNDEVSIYTGSLLRLR